MGVGIILLLLLMVVMTGRGLGAGGKANVEAIGAGGLTAIVGSFSTFLYLFSCMRLSFLLLATITRASARSGRLFVLGFSVPGWWVIGLTLDSRDFICRL